MRRPMFVLVAGISIVMLVACTSGPSRDEIRAMVETEVASTLSELKPELIGPPGSRGESGPQGPQGMQGPQGTPGPPGEPGLTPSEEQLVALIDGVTTARADELRGPRGTQGPPGLPGDKGSLGPRGPEGQPGKGLDAGVPLPALKTELIEIVDEDGVVRAELSASNLKFYTSDGVVTVELGVLFDFSGQLVLNDKDSEGRVELSTGFGRSSMALSGTQSSLELSSSIFARIILSSDWESSLDLSSENSSLNLTSLTQPPLSGLSHKVVFTRAVEGDQFNTNVADIRDSVVKLDSGIGEGSGILISESEILTAYHVVEGKSGVNATIEGVGARFASVTGYDKARDIALLTFTASSNASLTIAEFADAVPVPGNSIVAIGFSAASELSPTLTFGHVTARIHWTDVDSTDIGIDAIINPGMSGGGVFNEEGLLVGLIRAKSVAADGVAYAVEVEQIQSLLSYLRSGVKR